MIHVFRFTAPRLSAERDLATRLHAGLSAAAAEADVAEPVQEGEAWAVWLDLGGDRYRIAVARDMGAQAPTWLVTVEHQAPVFVRRQKGHARHQSRFDALIAAVRTVLFAEPDTSLIDEHDD